jgi:hypothetical protein
MERRDGARLPLSIAGRRGAAREKEVDQIEDVVHVEKAVSVRTCVRTEPHEDPRGSGSGVVDVAADDLGVAV